MFSSNAGGYSSNAGGSSGGYSSNAGGSSGGYSSNAGGSSGGYSSNAGGSSGYSSNTGFQQTGSAHVHHGMFKPAHYHTSTSYHHHPADPCNSCCTIL